MSLRTRFQGADEPGHAGPGHNEFTLGFTRIAQALNLSSQNDLAVTLRIRQSSISDAKRRGVIPGEWALKLFRRYGLNPRWVYDGLPPVFMKAPSSRADADTAHAAMLVDPSFLLRYQPDSLRAMRVEDASMEPLIRRDAYVGVNTTDKTPVDGGVFGLLLPVEGFCVRRLHLDPQNRHVLVKAENPAIKAQRMVREALPGAMLGKVVWVMHRP